jgi:hypothetical protein
VDMEIRDAARVATGHAHTAARHDIFHAPLLNHLLSHWTAVSVFSTYSFAAYRFASLLTTLPPSPAQLLLLTATFFLSPLTYEVCVRGKKKLTYPRRVSPPPPGGRRPQKPSKKSAFSEWEIFVLLQIFGHFLSQIQWFLFKKNHENH